MNLRTNNLDKLDRKPYDVLVVGGGINGAVSAAALSAKGARVGLVDRGDFASFTSQQSSNLAWGGIKYMESMEFGLVRKLCASRNALLRAFPSSVREIRFFASLDRGFRYPAFALYLATLLYWAIGRFFTRRPRWIRRGRIAVEEPVVAADRSIGGFEYSDAYLHDNDSRFVFRFIRQAMNHGCIAANYVEVTDATWTGDHWRVIARDVESGRTFDIETRAIVNACGPFADVFNEAIGQKTQHRHVFSKGIHLIVDRVTTHKRVLTFFADDGRPFFAIPMGRRTVIGTTDTRVPTPYAEVTDADRAFVLDNINKRLRLERPLTIDDVIAERCGVRPLVVEASTGTNETSDWTKLSRKHVLELDRERRYVSILGGKLTDCINVGDEVSARMAAAGVVLPYPDYVWYGEPPESVRSRFFHEARLMGLDGLAAPYAAEPLSSRLWRRYGRAAFDMLEDIRRDPAMGDVLIGTSEYLRCELTQTAEREMIVRLEDFLRRRSKIALVVERERLMASKGLVEACRILFGAAAEQRWREYFGEPAPDLLRDT